MGLKPVVCLPSLPARPVQSVWAPQRRSELSRMVRHGLGTAGVPREGAGRDVQLLRHQATNGSSG